MKSITVYSFDNCPYCVKAKNLLTAKGLSFQEIMVNRNDFDKIQELAKKSGMRTFPQIYFDDQLVGGHRELEALDRDGKLN